MSQTKRQLEKMWAATGEQDYHPLNQGDESVTYPGSNPEHSPAWLRATILERFPGHGVMLEIPLANGRTLLAFVLEKDVKK